MDDMDDTSRFFVADGWSFSPPAGLLARPEEEVCASPARLARGVRRGAADIGCNGLDTTYRTEKGRSR